MLLARLCFSHLIHYKLFDDDLRLCGTKFLASQRRYYLYDFYK